MSEKPDPRVEIMCRVNAEHRVDRAWCFGYGEEMGYAKNTAGSVCRCGAEFVRIDRDADPHGEWHDHWAAESLAALESAGWRIVKLEQVGCWGWRHDGRVWIYGRSVTEVTENEGAVYRIIEGERDE